LSKNTALELELESREKYPETYEAGATTIGLPFSQQLRSPVQKQTPRVQGMLKSQSSK